MNKAIITVVGQDTVGIIARVCTYLSEHNVNVLDISQTIIDGYFNMMMIVDYANADKDFGAMSATLRILATTSACVSAASVKRSSPRCTVSDSDIAFDSLPGWREVAHSAGGWSHVGYHPQSVSPTAPASEGEKTTVRNTPC